MGENALAAINLGLPILYFYLGVGLCVGVGGTVICGRLIGAKEANKASEVFSQTIVTAGVICILTSIAVFLLFSPILKVLRANGELSVYFTQYYRIMLFTYPLMVMSTILGFAVYGYSMIAIGFGQGLTPLVSICWGAKEQKTAMELRGITNKVLFTIGVLFAVFFFVFGKRYAGMFGCSDAVAGMVSTGFRFYAATFLFLGFTFLFSALWGMTGVWLAAPATEVLTTVVSVWLIMKQKKNLESR